MPILVNTTIATFDGMSDIPGFMGPYEDTTSSNLFAVLTLRGVQMVGMFLVPAVWAEVWMSSDGGFTWAAQDNTNHILCFATSGPEWATTRSVYDVAGRNIHVMFVDPGTQGITLVAFDTNALTWGTPTAPGPVPAAFSSDTVFPNFTFARRSDDTFVAYASYENPPTFENFAQYLYDFAGLGGWDVVFKTPALPGGAINAIQSSLFSESGSDLTHGFTWSNVPEIFDYALPYFFNAAQTLLTTSFGGRISNEPQVGHGLSWDNAGTWNIAVGYMQVDDLHVIEGLDQDNPTFSTDTFLGTLSSGFGTPLSSVVLFGGARYVLAVTQNVDFSSNIVYWVNSGTGWTGPVTVLANCPNAFNLSAFSVAGGIGVVYDDTSGAIGDPRDLTKFLLFTPGGSAGCRYRGYLMM